jgi:hypothetical protein
MHKTISTKIDMISSTKYMMCLNYKGRSPYNGKLSDFSFYIAVLFRVPHRPDVSEVATNCSELQHRGSSHRCQ